MIEESRHRSEGGIGQVVKPAYKLCPGGQREFSPVLARAACAAGVSAILIETYQDPDNGPSGRPNMIPLIDMKGLIADLWRFGAVSKRKVM